MKIIKMKGTIKKFSVNAVLLGSLFIIGCAKVPVIQAHNIVVSPHEISSLEVNSELKENIHLYDVGGEETSSFWSYNLDVFDFRTALNQSLIDANYLGNPLDSDFDLRANVLDVDKPFIGLNLTVTTTVEYILRERNSGEEILKESIVETFTAKFSDASYADVRLVMAIEGSARKNIHEFLQALSKLKIKKHKVSTSM
jgi:hypothetical protein